MARVIHEYQYLSLLKILDLVYESVGKHLSIRAGSLDIPNMIHKKDSSNRH